LSDAASQTTSGYRLTIEPGRWHFVEPPLSVMVVSVPRGRRASYALVSSDPHHIEFSVVRVDWATLAVWGLAEPLGRPTPVSPITAEEDP
jgi:hypothetical protein